MAWIALPHDTDPESRLGTDHAPPLLDERRLREHVRNFGRDRVRVGAQKVRKAEQRRLVSLIRDDLSFAKNLVEPGAAGQKSAECAGTAKDHPAAALPH